VPGTVPLVGFQGHHIERLPGGRYQFALHIFSLPQFAPGDEKNLLRDLEAPATVAVTDAGSG